MTGPIDDDKLAGLLKDIYRTAEASPEFKERLRQRLNEQAGISRALESKAFCRRPFLWAPAAAATAVALVLVIVLVVVPVLSPVEAPTPSDALGTLQVRVADAKDEPEVTAIEVTFDNISVHRAGDEGESGGERITVAENLGRTVNLLRLSDIGELLGQDEIEAGHYTQIRVGVTKVRVTIDGVSTDIGLEPTGDAKISSGGLKFVHNFEVRADETTVITIDFDISADKSLVFAGGKWIFKPTIKLDIAPASR